MVLLFGWCKSPLQLRPAELPTPQVDVLIHKRFVKHVGVYSRGQKGILITTLNFAVTRRSDSGTHSRRSEPNSRLNIRRGRGGLESRPVELDLGPQETGLRY